MARKRQTRLDQLSDSNADYGQNILTSLHNCTLEQRNQRKVLGPELGHHDARDVDGAAHADDVAAQ
eukprot:4084993-Alexandrium_andersonii.AAC.1